MTTLITTRTMTTNNLQPITYNYIVTGGGCSGLSLIMHILSEPSLSNKKILLIEQSEKNLNDRTWCFWEQGKGFFESVVCKQWSSAWFHADGYSSLKELGSYRYKMIRGIEFYRYCYEKIASSPNVRVVHDKVVSIQQESGGVKVFTEQGEYTGEYTFNSILFDDPMKQKNAHHLLQHFKGWVIETAEDAFDLNACTLMDFRVGQQHGTTFVYVMPLTKRKALVEYTLFTEQLLKDDQYVDGLKNYIKDFLKGVAYTIEEEEFGIIPMTSAQFKREEGNTIFIGTAGGQTKASSGFTFMFIQKQSTMIVDRLKKTGKPFYHPTKMQQRYNWFDKVLLNVLIKQRVPGSVVFKKMFQKNPIDRIFRFLDNETQLHEELRLITTLPTFPFLQAGMEEI
ncbi:MAG: lycopene cyclase family protein [Bacteroidota bacterium]